VSSLKNPYWIGQAVVPAAWAWILLVVVLSFWGAWDIPSRLPDINEVATTHLFLAPVSLMLFLLVSWTRKHFDDDEAHPGPRPFARWRATLGIWLLAFLHPVSCGLYPAAFNLDTRTVEDISRAVSSMQVGMPRDEVEQRIVELNAALPISMQMDQERHRRDQQDVARYLAEQDPAARRQRANSEAQNRQFRPVVREIAEGEAGRCRLGAPHGGACAPAAPSGFGPCRQMGNHRFQPGSRGRAATGSAHRDRDPVT